MALEEDVPSKTWTLEVFSASSLLVSGRYQVLWSHYIFESENYSVLRVVSSHLIINKIPTCLQRQNLLIRLTKMFNPSDTFISLIMNLLTVVLNIGFLGTLWTWVSIPSKTLAKSKVRMAQLRARLLKVLNSPAAS